MNDKIKKYIHDTMKSYNVSNLKLEKELVLACCDEYSMQTANGVSPYEAYEMAISNVVDIVKSMIKPSNKFAFSFGICILALVISIGEMFASLLSACIYFYEVEMAIVCGCWVVIMILYAVIKRKSLRWYNFLILVVLLASWLVSFFIIFPLFFFNGPPGCYQNMSLIFPCVFERHLHRDWFAEGYYETDYLFYANFLISLVMFVTTLVLFIKERVKIKNI